MKELLTQFGIDWKLLSAQVVNFFILLTILRIFAYKPILAMLHKRRDLIDEGLKASEESKRRLAETQEDQKKILLKAEQDGLALVSEAEQVARQQEAKLVAEAHKKSDQILAAGHKKLEQDTADAQEKVAISAHDLIKLGVSKVVQRANVDDILINEAVQELRLAARKI